jgi:hypothetical protein
MAKKGRERGRSDAAGVGPYVRKDVRLERLGELDSYKIAEGEPDIRGWEVRTISGRQLGEVADLLVDTAAGEVVMLDVDARGEGRHRYAPVRAAMIDRTARVVRLDTGDLRDEPLAPLGAGGEATDVAPAERRVTDGTIRYPPQQDVETR